MAGWQTEGMDGRKGGWQDGSQLDTLVERGDGRMVYSKKNSRKKVWLEWQDDRKEGWVEWQDGLQ